MQISVWCWNDIDCTVWEKLKPITSLIPHTHNLCRGTSLIAHTHTMCVQADIALLTEDAHSSIRQFVGSLPPALKQQTYQPLLFDFRIWSKCQFTVCIGQWGFCVSCFWIEKLTFKVCFSCGCFIDLFFSAACWLVKDLPQITVGNCQSHMFCIFCLLVLPLFCWKFIVAVFMQWNCSLDSWEWALGYIACTLYVNCTNYIILFSTALNVPAGATLLLYMCL